MVAPSGATFPYPTTEMTKSPLSGVRGGGAYIDKLRSQLAMPTPVPFRYFKTSPEIIQLAVMLYVKFPLSLRNSKITKRELTDKFLT